MPGKPVASGLKPFLVSALLAAFVLVAAFAARQADALASPAAATTAPAAASFAAFRGYDPTAQLSGQNIVVLAGGNAAEDGGQLLLGPGTTIGDHVAGQLANRGWTERLVQSTIDDPASTVATRDIRNLLGGGRMDDPATGYISRRGGYVVQNNRTGDVVQVSNRTDPGRLAPWDR